MGVWGIGNFESDDAMDLLMDWIKSISDQIRATYHTFSDIESLISEGETAIVSNIDLLTLIIDHYDVLPLPLLDSKEIIQWREVYLTAFDKRRDSLIHVESVNFANNRRKVIEETFEKLESILSKLEKELDDLN